MAAVGNAGGGDTFLYTVKMDVALSLDPASAVLYQYFHASSEKVSASHAAAYVANVTNGVQKDDFSAVTITGRRIPANSSDPYMDETYAPHRVVETKKVGGTMAVIDPSETTHFPACEIRVKIPSGPDAGVHICGRFEGPCGSTANDAFAFFCKSAMSDQKVPDFDWIRLYSVVYDTNPPPLGTGYPSEIVIRECNNIWGLGWLI